MFFPITKPAETIGAVFLRLLDEHDEDFLDWISRRNVKPTLDLESDKMEDTDATPVAAASLGLATSEVRRHTHSITSSLSFNTIKLMNYHYAGSLFAVISTSEVAAPSVHPWALWDVWTASSRFTCLFCVSFQSRIEEVAVSSQDSPSWSACKMHDMQLYSIWEIYPNMTSFKL